MITIEMNCFENNLRSSCMSIVHSFLPVSIMSGFPGMRERSQLMKNRPLRNISKMIRDLPSISMLRI